MYTMKCDGQDFYSPFAASEGYGVLSPKIDSELNRAGSLTFTLPPDNVMYSAMKKLKSIITVYWNGEEIFRGRVLHDDRDYYNRKHVYCEGELAFLMDSVIRPYQFSGRVADLFARFLQEHNSQVEPEKQFSVGVVELSDLEVEEQYEKDVFVPLEKAPEDWERNFGSFYLKEDGTYYKIVADAAPEFEANAYYRKDTEALTRMTRTERESTRYTKTLDEMLSQLVEEFGGFLRIRRENGARYLDYVSSCGEGSGQIISCGENLLDLSQFITAEKLVTCLIPVGSEEDGEKTTIAAVNGGVDYIENPAAVNLFGRIWAVKQWDDIANPEKLKRKAEEYLHDNISMNVSITLKAIDLSLVDVDAARLKLGDSVRVVSAPHGLDSLFVCRRIVLDLVEPDKSEYTFGYSFGALTDEQTEENKRIYGKIESSKIIGNRAQKIANEALSAANSARSYAVGTGRALKKDVAALAASDKALQAGLSAKVSGDDLRKTLENYVLASQYGEKFKAAAELYATDGDFLSVIGSYIITDANGNRKSLAAMLADVIKLQGDVSIVGNLSISDGKLRVEKSIITPSTVFANKFSSNDAEMLIGGHRLNIGGDFSADGNGIAFGQKRFTPQTVKFLTSDSYKESRLLVLDTEQYEDYGNPQGADEVIKEMTGRGEAMRVPANPTRVSSVTGTWTGQPRMLVTGDKISIVPDNKALYDCTTWRNVYPNPIYRYRGYMKSSHSAQTAEKTVLAQSGGTAVQNFAFDMAEE